MIEIIMKRAILLIVACTGLLACGGGPAKRNAKAAGQPEHDRIEVLSFPGAQRCATCVAIEKNAKAAVEAAFGQELKNGAVVFSTIDLSDPANEAIADRYEVTWSSLIVVAWKDGVERAEDLTAFAFAHARTAPETFREGLIEKMNEMRK